MPKIIKGIGLVFTIQEIMELLDVSEITIRSYYKSGKLKGKQIGNHFYITETALKDFLKRKHIPKQEETTKKDVTKKEKPEPEKKDKE
jgi:excisionase family DNA binding protein